jgi:hypothetical protein
VNIKRLILAIFAAFVFYFLTDFFIHGVWLAPAYKATANLWRTDAEMQARFPWLIAAHFVYAIAFVILWAMGFAGRFCIRGAVWFGLLMGLFFQCSTLISYVVSPLPSDIAIEWFASGIVQALLLGLITSFTYAPHKAQAPA